MQNLRTPWGDRTMVFVTELGDDVLIALVAAAVLSWLLLWRNWRAAGYWIAAIGFGQLAATMLKLVLRRPQPLAGINDGLTTYAFPSNHATMSMVVYGFLAVFAARQIPTPRRWLVYAPAALLVTAIAMSRLHLGAHWLSDVLGGLSLGLAWVSLLGLAYYRHSPPVSVPKGVPGVALLTLALAGGWHVSEQFSADLQRYTPGVVVQHLAAVLWWQDDWRRLPAYRQDLEGEFEQALNVQWSGTLVSLHEKLRAQGWRDPVPLSATTALRWLLPTPSLAELPVLPQVHNGSHESLLMLGPAEKSPAQGQPAIRKEQRLVLRLWRSGIVLDSDAIPLWVGNVAFQEQRRILFLRLPVTAREYDVPLELLMESLDGVDRHMVERALDAVQSESPWNGRMVLIRDERPPGRQVGRQGQVGTSTGKGQAGTRGCPSDLPVSRRFP